MAPSAPSSSACAAPSVAASAVASPSSATAAIPTLNAPVAVPERSPAASSTAPLLAGVSAPASHAPAAPDVAVSSGLVAVPGEGPGFDRIGQQLQLTRWSRPRVLVCHTMRYNVWQLRDLEGPRPPCDRMHYSEHRPPPIPFRLPWLCLRARG